MNPTDSADRRGEWYVPQRGPLALRVAIGLMFLPYTGMVIAFTVIGAALSPNIHSDRVLALAAIYFLALGIGAHALDAIGSPQRPWGTVFTARQLRTAALASIGAAYAIGVYYMSQAVPLLWPVALAEGFFLLAYNLEWFGGRFHTDGWFAFSWGALPTLAGFVMQTNRVSAAAVIASLATALIGLIEIKASRPYKALRRLHDRGVHARAYESILKCLSAGTMLLAIALLIGRWS